MIRSFFLFVAVLCCCNLLDAQNVFNPGDALVTYNAAATPGTSTNPNVPANGVMAKWVRTPRVSWTTTKFKSYIWNGMVFRMRFPNNYSATNATKYPVIVFFHGGGEIGPVTDNEDQLLWGAQLFEQRIDAGAWNGFMIFPQETTVGWDNTHFDRLTGILDTLQKYNNSDIDRVISMGLSSGGFGSLAYADWYSQRIATTIAASPAQVSALSHDVPGFFQTPLWIANGGTDLNPDPFAIVDFYSAFRNQGGNIYRSYYVNNGHNTWTDMWNETDASGKLITTTYWNAAHKAQPVVYFQNAQFCTDSAISARMAVSPGFNTYEWQLNNATIAGATGNEYVATQAGTYRVRFKRTAGAAWSAWTPTPVVISTKVCAVDTLYAEHFSSDNPYSAAAPYTISNYTCQGGVLTPGTDLFTQDASGKQGNRYLVNYTKGGTGCTITAGDKVWGTVTPIPVRTNTNYEYSFYLGNQNATSLAQIAPTINGTALTTTYVQATGTGNASWKKFTFTWNSGTATSATLGLINRSAITAGNDFAIDEIAFRPVPIAVPSCTANTLPANAAVLTTSNTATLKWTAATNATAYSIYLWTGSTVPVLPVATVTSNSYTATGLLGATQYKWYVTPRNANNVPATGCSANQTSFTTAAAPPACIANILPADGSTLSTTTTASLSWNASTGASSYDIFLWKGATAPTTATANVTATSYNATALTASSIYNWYVVPKNAAGAATGCNSNATDFTTAAIPVPVCVTNTAPANGTTLTTQTSATLSWPSSPTATSYDVYLTAGTGIPTTLVTNTTALTYAAAGLTANTTYSWYIAPRNASGANSSCGTANKTSFTTAAGVVTLAACVSNAAPANGAVLVTQKSARLFWPSSPSATSYDVYLAAGNAVPTILVANTTALTFYAIGLTANTQYSWYIAPRNANGANTACGAANKTSFITAVATGGANTAPVSNAGIAASITLPVSTVTLDGSASYDADGNIAEFYWYVLQAPVTTSIGDVFSTTPTVTGLTTAGSYVYGLQVKDNTGATAYSQVTITVNAAGTNLVPACVTNASPTAGSTLATQTSATLNWPSSATAISYDVYLAAGAGIPTTLVTNTTLLTYTLNSLNAGTLYSWYIAPRNANGAATACATGNRTSFTTAAATVALPACVINASPAAGAMLTTQTTALLSWPSAATATSYDVYLAAGTGVPATLVGNTTALTYTAAGLTAGTLYSWYIAPRNASGAATTCGTSNKTSFTTAALTLAACVTNSLPAAGATLPTQTSARLSWPVSAGATSYDVYLAAGSGVPGTLVANTTAPTYYAITLTANTLYSWFIAPRNASGANTACGSSNRTSFTTAVATGGANLSPVANAGTSASITLPISTVTLDAGASYDPDGRIAEFYWYVIQAPATTTIGTNFTATPTTTVTGLTTAGSYVYGLQVKDNTGATAYSQVSVTVNSSGVRIADTTITVQTRELPVQAAIVTSPLGSTTALPVITGSVSPNPVTPGRLARLMLKAINQAVQSLIW